MSFFNSYGCLYTSQKVNNLTEQKENKTKLNELRCEPQILLFKKRFYGINFFCKGILKSESDDKVETRNFYDLYDSELKAEITKQDFTNSDIKKFDDSQKIEFGLSPVGLFLYYLEPSQKQIYPIQYLPFYDLRKNFEFLGKSKRYLRQFELR